MDGLPVPPELLQELLTSHGAVLELMAARWCGEPEDCLQEGIARLARLRQPPESPAAWLYRVVRNEAITRCRRATARKRHEQSAGRESMERWFVCQPSSSEFAPSQAADALAVLDDEALELVLLRIWGKLSLREIADATETSVTTVHRRFHEALAQLRERLESTCPSQTD